MSNPGGRLPRQDTVDTIIRSLQARVRALEQAISSIGTGGTIISDAPHVYSLTAPVMSWTITHNKGRYVIVKMYDSTGQEIEVDISCPDLNSVVLTGDEPFSGKAIIS